jgi:hypothetical protein
MSKPMEHEEPIEDEEEHEEPIEDEDGELTYVRHLEILGYHEHRAFEEWEASRGVVSFADAFAQSLGYVDAAEREAREKFAEEQGLHRSQLCSRCGDDATVCGCNA